ncbi:MAG: M20/M25/M40 family metallo-hydrolase [Nitrospirae bacterium]|nr:MAG: M20/M25/M40 family metallo-hydrolase [Nitrospirota bacterium]
MVREDLISRQRLQKVFLELVNINSPSFEETVLGEFLIKALERCGCTVLLQEYDRSFNLIGRMKGNAPGFPPLLLSAHMDTIEPTEGIRISIDDEKIRSAGETVLGADDKSAIAQILEALAVIAGHDLPHGDLEVVFTSAEERGLIGARSLDFSALASRHAVVLDSAGSVGNIIIGAPTHLTYEMTVVGRAAHAGIEPEKGISAIRAAAQIIASVPDGRLNSGTTANIGMIRGGTATNVVPKEVVIRGEIRSHDQEMLLKVRDEIRGRAEQAASEHQVEVKISEHEEYRTFRLDPGEPFVRYMAGTLARCGIEPVLTLTGGGSDASVFNEMGIRAVNISNGMQKVHSNEEFILQKDLFDGCRVLLECISGMASFEQ